MIMLRNRRHKDVKTIKVNTEAKVKDTGDANVLLAQSTMRENCPAAAKHNGESRNFTKQTLKKSSW